jgi:hypothetical protein
MSRYSGMSRTARRAWGIGSILFFILMCAMIAYGQQRADRNAYACEHGLAGCPYGNTASR